MEAGTLLDSDLALVKQDLEKQDIAFDVMRFGTTRERHAPYLDAPIW